MLKSMINPVLSRKKLMLIALFTALIFYSCGAGDFYKKKITNSRSYEIPIDTFWNLVLNTMTKKLFTTEPQTEE